LRHPPSEATQQVAEGGSGSGDFRGNIIQASTVTVTTGGEPQSPPAVERNVLDVPLDQLTKLYEDHTSIQADQLAKPYLGKWLEVEGAVSEARALAKEGETIVVLRVTEDLFVVASFRPEWAGRVAMLNKDSRVTLVGKIQRFDKDSIMLADSEVVQRIVG
jgi:hypothetical protein